MITLEKEVLVDHWWVNKWEDQMEQWSGLLNDPLFSFRRRNIAEILFILEQWVRFLFSWNRRRFIWL